MFFFDYLFLLDTYTFYFLADAKCIFYTSVPLARVATFPSSVFLNTSTSTFFLQFHSLVPTSFLLFSQIFLQTLSS